MSPVEELRAAAARLREMAKGTTRGPWEAVDGVEMYPRWILGRPAGDSPYAADVAKSYADGGGDGVDVSDADWAWMAFAHPGLAEPLAEWLEQTARGIQAHIDVRSSIEQLEQVHAHALAVARVIVGPAGGES